MKTPAKKSLTPKSQLPQQESKRDCFFYIRKQDVMPECVHFIEEIPTDTITILSLQQTSAESAANIIALMRQTIMAVEKIYNVNQPQQLTASEIN